ncbi:hypothetical protein ACTXT7_005236 [Hymenolepis weldensis]
MKSQEVREGFKLTTSSLEILCNHLAIFCKISQYLYVNAVKTLRSPQPQKTNLSESVTDFSNLNKACITRSKYYKWHFMHMQINLSNKVAGKPHTGGILVYLLIKTNGRNLSFIIFKRETVCMANLQCSFSPLLQFPVQLMLIHLSFMN